MKTGSVIKLFPAVLLLGAAVFWLLSGTRMKPAADPEQAAGDVRITARADARAGEAPDPEETAREGGQLRETARVVSVIDGDTIIVEGNRTVRLLGIDTPERGEPFYAKARDALRRAIGTRPVRLVSCREEQRDRYGRLLAFVEADRTDSGAELLRLGLARTLFVGPCARPRETAYRQAERAAFLAGRGIWSLQEPRRVDHTQAGKYIGWMMSVSGAVRNVHVGPRAVHLNFGGDYRTDFTAVIFRKDLAGLSREGLLLPVTGYRGRRVVVTGSIKEYNGPEVLINSAGQIVLVNGESLDVAQ